MWTGSQHARGGQNYRTRIVNTERARGVHISAHCGQTHYSVVRRIFGSTGTDIGILKMGVIVTYITSSNVDVIKYWGNRDDKLNLPINDSISFTLDAKHFGVKTTIMASPDFKEDRIWVNRCEESMNNIQLKDCIKRVKKRARHLGEMGEWKIHICTESNFPTAADFDSHSSAARYACLAVTLAKLYKVESDISTLVRRESGLACRSTYGGCVRWFKGSDPKGNDSMARVIAPSSHWAALRILILVVNDPRRKVTSEVGMRRAVETSEFLKYRVETFLPERVEKMQRAICEKDFETFAKLTMVDSNQMHAACMEASPPLAYLSDTSHLITELVHEYNAASKQTKVAYTFDAGPNAILFLLEKDVPEFFGVLDHYFPPSKIAVGYRKGIDKVQPVKPKKEFLQKLNFTKQLSDKLKFIIHTKVGCGPKQLPETDHLLNSQGLPKYLHARMMNRFVL